MHLGRTCRLVGIFLAALILVLTVATPVFAYLYRAPLAIIESGGTAYTALPISCPADVDWLIANGFITNTTALDTRVETAGGAVQIHMVADDKIMAFVPSLEADSQINWYLSTGNAALSGFPVIVGDGGYVNVADHNDLELGNNFSIEFEGWIDTSASDDLVEKGDDFLIATTSSDIYSKIYLSPTVEATNTSTSAWGTSHIVNLPSGVQSGDLLLMVLGGHSVNDPTITWPLGWTELAKHGYCPTTCSYIGIAYNISDGSTGATVTVTTDVDCAAAHHTFRIDDYQGVPEVSSSAQGTSAAPDSASLSPSWGTSEYTLYFSVFGGSDADVVTVSSYPSGYSGGQLTRQGAATNSYVGSSRRLVVGSPENPGAYTLSDTIRWIAYTVGIEGDSMIVTATGVSSKESTVEVWADTTDFGIDIDGVTQNTTALAGASVTDNANNWSISNLPYMNYYKHYVNGVLIAWYQPISYIVGTTLPDREGVAQNGIITWGSNPAGVSATLGSLVGAAQPEAGATIEDEYRAMLPETDVSDWFVEPDISTSLAANPFRPLVTIMSDSTTLTEVQAWRFLGLALLLLVTVAAAKMLRGHLFIAGLACAGTIGLLVQQTVWPFWALVFIIPAIVAGLIAERTPSI